MLLQKIYTIDETDFPLSMRPAYRGEKLDMNRANKVRTVMKGLTKVANQTGCSIVLVGYLNKSQTANSALRSLSSVDFRAAAQSVLLIGWLKYDRDVWVTAHDKSSPADEDPSCDFTLESGTLHWHEACKWSDIIKPHT